MPQRSDAHTPGRHVAKASPAERRSVLWAMVLFLGAGTLFALVVVALAMR
jgi:hypothetical protein